MRPEGYSGEDGGEYSEESELVPNSLAPIVPILRAANEIEEENQRVAYLCACSAFPFPFFFFYFSPMISLSVACMRSYARSLTHIGVFLIKKSIENLLKIHINSFFKFILVDA